jgi:hypothetical protein
MSTAAGTAVPGLCWAIVVALAGCAGAVPSPDGDSAPAPASATGSHYGASSRPALGPPAVAEPPEPVASDAPSPPPPAVHPAPCGVGAEETPVREQPLRWPLGRPLVVVVKGGEVTVAMQEALGALHAASGPRGVDLALADLMKSGRVEFDAHDRELGPVLQRLFEAGRVGVPTESGPASSVTIVKYDRRMGPMLGYGGFRYYVRDCRLLLEVITYQL